MMSPRAINIAAAIGALIIAYAAIYTALLPFVMIGGTVTLLWIGWLWLIRRHPLIGWALLGFIRGLPTR
jgi:hypothetical protein